MNLLLAFLIFIVNNFTELSFEKIGNFAKQKFKGSRDKIVFRGLFSIMYLNIGITVVLVYSNVGYLKPIEGINYLFGTPFFLSQGYQDTSRDWFINVGSTLVQFSAFS